MKLDEAIHDLECARKRLVEEQGRIARRNARVAVVTALKKIRAALDRDYPLERKPVTKRKKRDPRRKYRGKVEITPVGYRRLLAAGCRPSAFVEQQTTTSTADSTATSPIRVYAPAWMARALNAGFDPALIAKAVRSQKTRRRIDGVIRLRQNTSAR